jgi:hypothetical protein
MTVFGIVEEEGGPATGNASEVYGKGIKALKSEFGSDALPFEIYSLIEGEESKIEIIGVITNFSQTWNSSYNEEVVYGRIDPIPTFSNTTRTISFGLDLITPSVDNIQYAESQIARAQSMTVGRLAQMCYPGYEAQGGTTEFNMSTLKSAPLVKIRYANLISGDEQESFLTAYMKSMSVSFATDKLTVVNSNKQVDYRRMSLAMEFGIVHDFDVGHSADGSQLNPSYPFNFE